MASTLSARFFRPSVYFKVRTSRRSNVMSADLAKVEDELYCVPRCEFENMSDVFKDMFGMPAGEDGKTEGLSKEHPIVLEGYLKADFDAVLKVMFPT